MQKQQDIHAAAAVAEVSDLLIGRSGTLCGSAMAAWQHDRPFAWNDVDVFVPSEMALAGTVEFLIQQGSRLDDENARTWDNWIADGVGRWHTNSLRLTIRTGIEVNVVYKVVDDRPLRDHMQVVSSFDFSNLSTSIDLRTGKMFDLFPYLWGGEDPKRVRLLPERERQWLSAKVGKFTGIRQAERFAKNVARGYDLDLCVEPLVTGYRLTALHYRDRSDPELHTYAEVYEGIADLIEVGDIQGLLDAYSAFEKHDPAGSLAKGLV